MKLLFDENFEQSVVKHFRSLGHDVKYVGDNYAGTADEEILAIALREKRIVITNDLDFGQLIFQELRPHGGVIMFRLTDQSIEMKIRVLELVVARHGQKLPGTFTIVDRRGVRIRKH